MENSVAAIWNLTPLVPEPRRTQLLAVESFDEVLRSVVSGSKVLRYAPEPFHNQRLHECVRAFFLLQIDPSAYDKFFNSPVGYRAQFCRSCDAGEQANRNMIDALRSKLLTFAEPCATPAFPPERIARSLDAEGAKIWIDENEAGSQPEEALQIHIDYQPWVERARRAEADQEEAFIGAIRGVFAPLGMRLEVKGGWLDCRGNEISDPIKACRSEEIARNGYS